MIKTATISECGLYRYTLGRKWESGKGKVCFVLLNPSTADAELDDQTLRKGVGFAKQWDFGSLVFVNLFAFRATKPKDMRSAEHPVGPDNDAHIQIETGEADMVVLAWGTNGGHRGRDKEVAGNLLVGCPGKLRHLGLTKGGHPRHPLMLSYATPLEKWK